MRVKIVKGKKGDIIGYPFCLIDRKEQNRVREGEEWEVEVKRTIRDRRGKEIGIVVPVRKVYRVEGDGTVYCGEVEVGKAEIKEESRFEYCYNALYEYRTRIYIFEGEELRRETEEITWKDIRHAPSHIRKAYEEERKKYVESGREDRMVENPYSSGFGKGIQKQCRRKEVGDRRDGEGDNRKDKPLSARSWENAN